MRGDRAVDDLLLRRVLYGDFLPQLRGRCRGDFPGRSGSRVRRCPVAHPGQRGAAAGVPGAGPVRRGRGGCGPGRFADATMVIALGITMTGEKRFLGFVETDTENAMVLTPFLRSLVERGLDLSQGVLVILEWRQGAPHGRQEGLPEPGPGPPVPVAQARERGELPGEARAGHVAPAPAARLQPTDVHRGAGRARDASSRADGSEPIGGRRLAEGLDETLSCIAWACMGCWPGFPIWPWYSTVRTSRRALISGAPT